MFLTIRLNKCHYTFGVFFHELFSCPQHVHKTLRLSVLKTSEAEEDAFRAALNPQGHPARGAVLGAVTEARQLLSIATQLCQEVVLQAQEADAALQMTSKQCRSSKGLLQKKLTRPLAAMMICYSQESCFPARSTFTKHATFRLENFLPVCLSVCHQEPQATTASRLSPEEAQFAEQYPQLHRRLLNLTRGGYILSVRSRGDRTVYFNTRGYISIQSVYFNTRESTRRIAIRQSRVASSQHEHLVIK